MNRRAPLEVLAAGVFASTLAGLGNPILVFVAVEGLTSTELSLSRSGLRAAVFFVVVAMVVVGATTPGLVAAFALVVRAGVGAD